MPKKYIVIGFIIFISISIIISIMIYADPFLMHPELKGVQKPSIDIGTLPKLVLAFYYPWYGTPQGPTGSWRHWDEAGHNPDNFIDGKRDLGATDYPIHGPYDSKNHSLIAWHLQLAEEAGVDGFIVSWWGPETFEDQAFHIMLDIAEEIDTPVKLTIYYEMVHTGRDGTAMEIERILKDYGSRDSFLKVQGYPVIFIYSRALGQMRLSDWDYVLRKVRYDGHNALFIVDSFDGRAAEVFDGTHTYNPVGILSQEVNLTDVYIAAKGVAEEKNVIFAATVLPGYDDTHIRQPGLTYPRDNGGTYNKTWKAAILSDANWVLICSWNEWHEGSEIEPSLEYGDSYVRLTTDHAKRFKTEQNP